MMVSDWVEQLCIGNIPHLLVLN